MTSLFDSFNLIFYAGGYLTSSPGTNFVITPYNNTTNFTYNTGSTSYQSYGSSSFSKVRTNPSRILTTQSTAQSPFTVRNDFNYSDIGSILLEANSTMYTLTNPNSPSTGTANGLVRLSGFSNPFTTQITSSFWSALTISGSTTAGSSARYDAVLSARETSGSWQQFITSSLFPGTASILISTYVSGSNLWQPGVTHSNQLFSLFMPSNAGTPGELKGVFRVDQQRIANSSEFNYNSAVPFSGSFSNNLFSNIIPQPYGVSKVTVGGFLQSASFNGTATVACLLRHFIIPSGSISYSTNSTTSSIYANQPIFNHGGLQFEKIVDELNISMSFNTASFIGSSLILNSQRGTPPAAPSYYTTRFSDRLYNNMSGVFTNNNEGSLILRYTTNPFWTNYGTSSIQFLIDSYTGDSLIHLRNNRIEYKTTSSTYEFIPTSSYSGINPAIPPKLLGYLDNSNTIPSYCYTLETGSFVNLGFSWSGNTLKVVADSGDIIEVNNFSPPTTTAELDFEPVLPLSQMRIQWILASGTQVDDNILQLATNQSLK
jgi:hypothetical protein